MSGFLMLRLSLRALALVGVAFASLQLALLVAQVRFLAGAGDIWTGRLGRGILLGLVVGAGVWLYGRSDHIATGVWRAVLRRRAI